MSTKFDGLYKKIMEQNLSGGEGSVFGTEASGEYAEGDNRLPHGMGTVSRFGKKKKKPTRKIKENCNLKGTEKPLSKYNQEDLIEGMRIESEHTDSMKTAKIIAAQHLDEDPNYYKKLKSVEEAKSCWDGYKKKGVKRKNGKIVNNCVKEEIIVDEVSKEITFNNDDEFFEAYGWIEYNEDLLNEAEYQGRTVTLNKPMQGDVKKFKVYVKNEKGNVVKVNFGDPNSTIKKNNPARRKSFRARHNCDNPGPKTKARYWSCKKW